MVAKIVDKRAVQSESLDGHKVTEDENRVGALTLTNMTPAQLTAGRTAGSLGYVPIGYYRGGVAFWDLDYAVKQPLVFAEQQHILGILDGREEGHDLVTVNALTTTPTLSVLYGTLTVPPAQVWYVESVEITVGVDPAPGVVLAGNWRCNLWTDRSVTPSVTGQAFYAANQVGNQFADFYPAAILFFGLQNKSVMLRLPAGTVVTYTIGTVGVPSVTVPSTLQLYGFIGKSLVA